MDEYYRRDKGGEEEVGEENEIDSDGDGDGNNEFTNNLEKEKIKDSLQELSSIKKDTL